MQKNTRHIIAIAALVVGLGVGYTIGVSKAPGTVAENSISGMHQMPDGSVMGHGGQTISMEDMMASMNAELEGKTGDAFDQEFITEMIMHHQGAVAMAQLALANSKHQELKDLAHAIIAAQNQEISEMKAWQQSWYGMTP